MKTEISTQAREFMVYIRTLMFYRSRLKGIDKDLKVYISTPEIERFFPYPGHNRTHEIEALVIAGELRITEGTSAKTGNKVFFYEALQPGEMDIRYIKPAPQSNDPLYLAMKRHLRAVSLKPGSPSTLYFDAFLKFKDRYLDVFFSRDEFCGRIHTPVTNFHAEYRQNILIGGQETTGFDVATMQPLLLGRILKDQIGDNEFSRWIDQGRDIYCELQNKAGLETRDQGKKRFFEILFSKPSDQLAAMFGESSWITWINEFKSKPLPANPHSQAKPHSNLAWLLQNTEVKLMRKVWQILYLNNIPFLSVHDEIICRLEDAPKTETIFRNVLQKEFSTFKLNRTAPPTAPEPEPEPAAPLQSIPKNGSVNSDLWNSQN